MIFFTVVPRNNRYDISLFLRYFRRSHPKSTILVLGDVTDQTQGNTKFLPLDPGETILPQKINTVLPPEKLAYIDISTIVLNPFPSYDLPPGKVLVGEDSIAGRCRPLYRECTGDLETDPNDPFIPLSYLGFSWDNQNGNSFIQHLCSVPRNEKEFNKAARLFKGSLTLANKPLVFRDSLIVENPQDYWDVVARVPCVNKQSLGLSVTHFDTDWGLLKGSPEIIQSLYHSITVRYFPELLTRSDNSWQVIVISRNQGNSIPTMVSSIRRQLPQIPVYFVLDRTTDNSAEMLSRLGVPWVLREGPENSFRAGSSRSAGISTFGAENTLFLDGDRIPFNLTEFYLNECLCRFDLACMRFYGGSEHRVNHAFCSDFAENTVLAPYVFHEDPKNKFYTNGFIISKKAIEAIQELLGGSLFYTPFDGKHGDEDVFLGAMASLLGFHVGFFPYHIGTGGPLTKGSVNPYATPDNRGLTLHIYDNLTKLRLNDDLSKGIPFEERREKVKKALSNLPRMTLKSNPKGQVMQVLNTRIAKGG